MALQSIPTRATLSTLANLGTAIEADLHTWTEFCLLEEVNYIKISKYYLPKYSGENALTDQDKSYILTELLCDLILNDCIVVADKTRKNIIKIPNYLDYKITIKTNEDIMTTSGDGKYITIKADCFSIYEKNVLIKDFIMEYKRPHPNFKTINIKRKLEIEPHNMGGYDHNIKGINYEYDPSHPVMIINELLNELSS